MFETWLKCSDYLYFKIFFFFLFIKRFIRLKQFHLLSALISAFLSNSAVGGRYELMKYNGIDPSKLYQIFASLYIEDGLFINSQMTNMKSIRCFTYTRRRSRSLSHHFSSLFSPSKSFLMFVPWTNHFGKWLALTARIFH